MTKRLPGYCDAIDVTILAGGGIRVVDNGRGIPVDVNSKTKKTGLEMAMTMLHAGGKFDGKAYAVSGGLHGVGLSVVNALSVGVDVQVWKDGFTWAQEYVNGKPGRLTKGEATNRSGTSITFWPDAKTFETTEFSFETIYRRLQETAFLNRGLTIVLRDERGTEEDTEPRTVTFCYKGGIADFVRHLNQAKSPIHKSVVEFGAEGDGMSVEIAMQWNESYGESVYTFANMINTHEGGTHEEGFRAALTTVVNRYGAGQEVPQGRRQAVR